MTVRLAQNIGMDRVIEYARRFGLAETMTPRLSMALGAGETTLIKLTAAYAMLVNGGKQITPSLIDRIQDRNGRTVFRHDDRACEGCLDILWSRGSVPRVPDEREKVADATSAYQMVRMLEGVVQRGTGRRIAELGKPLAGKTGTTNNNIDTWFIGFTPDLTVGTFVGFDQPRTLGRRDTGSNVAAPLFKMFMKRALEGQPEIPFRAPPGILHVRIDTQTGSLARAGDKNVILEAFKPGTDPKGESTVIDGGYSAGWKPKVGEAAVAGTGRGLY